MNKSKSVFVLETEIRALKRDLDRVVLRHNTLLAHMDKIHGVGCANCIHPENNHFTDQEGKPCAHCKECTGFERSWKYEVVRKRSKKAS